jgi:PAS domain S-box-containing protein
MRQDVFERRILDALPLTIYTVDLDGRITSTNRSWARFAQANGASALADESTVLGTSIWDAVVDRSPREAIERAMMMLRTGRAQVMRWEFPCNSPDEERVFLMQITPIRSGERPNEHAVTGFVFSTVDITPSHRSREALLDAGIALSRTIILERVYVEAALQARRAIPCEAFALAIANGETAALHVALQSGYEDETPDGDVAPLETRLTPVWLEALANECIVARRIPAAESSDDGVHGAEGLELTVPLTSTEGVLGAMTIRSTGLENNQRVHEAERVLATIAAQTSAAIERALLVRRVEQKRRLEAIGEVAAGVAHELRNPLFGISSAAQLLRFRAKEDPVVEKNAGRILREVERLNRMVTDLLEFGRANTARLVAGDPDRVWDDVLDGQRGRLESRALQLRRHRAEPAARCLIDPEQLAQVYLNVLVNAVDAAPEASDLTLSSSVLPNGSWKCRLHNGGPAIPAESLARAFEIFYSTKAGGTGIGLALCQRIMDEHAGTITLESAPETGTVLTIVLPGVARSTLDEKLAPSR